MTRTATLTLRRQYRPVTDARELIDRRYSCRTYLERPISSERP